MPRNRPLRSILAAAGISAALAAPARAQWQVTPTFGIFMPVQDALVRQIGGVNGSPVPYPILEKWQTGGMVATGRVGYWFTDRWGLEFSGAYSPGLVATRDSLNTVRSRPAKAYFLALRSPVRLTTPGATLAFHFAPGIGYITRTGTAWDGYGDRSDIALALSVGGRGRLGRRSKVWFRFELEDYLTNARFSLGGVPLNAQLHHDMVYSVGLDFFLGWPGNSLKPGAR